MVSNRFFPATSLVVLLIAGSASRLQAAVWDIKFDNKGEKAWYLWPKPTSPGVKTYAEDSISMADSQAPSNAQKADYKTPGSYLTIRPKMLFKGSLFTKNLSKGALFHVVVSNAKPDSKENKGTISIEVSLELKEIVLEENKYLPDKKKVFLRYDSTSPSNQNALDFPVKDDVQYITFK